MTGEVDDEFAQALRAAIAQRGLSLGRVRYHLAQRGHEVSVATLSYWQSARSRPERAASLAALAQLEEVLRVPPGGLSRRLPSRRRGVGKGGAVPMAAEARLESLLDDGGVADRLVESLGMSWDEGVRRISVHDRIEIGAERCGMTHTIRELLVANRSGCSRFPLCYRYQRGGDHVDLTAVHNCQIGRLATEPDQRLLVAEIQLGRILQEGETVLVEHRIQMPEVRITDQFVERGVIRTVRSAHTEVVFPAEAMPLSAERYTVVDGQHKAEPMVIAGPSLHALVLDFGPGLYGLRWTW
ncbi:MAG: hypothetical protein ABI746_11705 [Dermatophilaceae bacterium]